MNRIFPRITRRDVIHMIRGTEPGREMKGRAMAMGVGNDFYTDFEWFSTDDPCWERWSDDELIELYKLRIDN